MLGISKSNQTESFGGSSECEVTALGAATYGKYAATILDVSQSELQLDLGTPLPKSVQVKVEFGGLVTFGEVVNLRSHDVGRYRVGVLISKITESRKMKQYESGIAMSLCALDWKLKESCQQPAA